MTIYYVDASRPDDTGDGLSEGTAKRTIRAARNLVAAGDTVKIKRGYCYDVSNGYFWPTLSGLDGGGFTITTYGSGDIPIWDGLNYENAGTSGWTYVAASGGVWKKQISASVPVLRIFADSSNTGVLIAQRTVGDGLRRCPVSGTTSISQNESEANIVAALQSFQFTAPWVPGRAATSYNLYMWTGSDTIAPPDYFNGLAMAWGDGVSEGCVEHLSIGDNQNVLVEFQHFRGATNGCILLETRNSDSGDTSNIEILDCSITHPFAYGLRTRIRVEADPLHKVSNVTIRRLSYDQKYCAAEQELTQGEGIRSEYDAVVAGDMADTWVIEDCTITNPSHGGILAYPLAFGDYTAPRNITVRNNTITIDSDQAYAYTIGSNGYNIRFENNVLTGQNARCAFHKEAYVFGNQWIGCRNSIRKPDTEQWFACMAYYYDTANGLSGDQRYISAGPTNVQMIGNYVQGTFEGTTTQSVILLESYASTYGVAPWPENALTVRNNIVVAEGSRLLWCLRNASPVTDAAAITTPAIEDNIFYAPGAAGTNRIKWRPVNSGAFEEYTVATAPGFSGNQEYDPMADTKISALSDGSAVQATDNIPAVRGATNVRVQIDLSDKVVGAASSVDSEIALFSGTGGKTIKRATTTGVLRADSGVISAATANTDYVTPARSKMLAADTWANRPDATTNGEYIFPCTNLGNGGFALFYSDGTDWRPLGGRLLLDSAHGTVASPVTSQAPNPSAAVTLKQTTIPAGLIPPQACLHVSAHVRKNGANATAGIQIRLGTAGSIADAILWSESITNSDKRESWMVTQARFGSSTTGFFGNSYGRINTQETNLWDDRTTNVDTDAAMTLGLYISASGSVSDSIAVHSYQVWLEA